MAGQDTEGGKAGSQRVSNPRRHEGAKKRKEERRADITAGRTSRFSKHR